jgi:DNA-binding LacI/PurR family transcriptional regulator
MAKRPRLNDVARLANVAPATASLVLNKRVTGNVRIPLETQQRVLAAAAKLGYVADPVAQSLAKGRNGLLGVFTFEAIFPITQRDFYYPFLLGIERAAETLGYDLLLFTSTSIGDGRRCIYRNGQNRLRLADGAVLLGITDSKSELQALVEEGYPFVFVGRRELPGAELSYVAADYAAATAEIIDRMCRVGHRRIAYVGFAQANESHLDRRRGYQEGLLRNDIPFDEQLLHLCAGVHFDCDDLQKLLRLGTTAIVSEIGPIIFAVLRTCEEMGLRIPEDLSIASLGDPDVEVEDTYHLSGFNIPREEMGAQAVYLLIQLLEEKEPHGARHLILPCTLVAGHTIAPPRSNVNM